MSVYTNQQRQLVVRRAMAAVRARLNGRRKLTVGGQSFVLDETGYCNRFIRQCFETALNMPESSWRFRGGDAQETLAKLEPYRVPLKSRRPGDILGFAGDPGHICLYLGREFDVAKELVAENTSSGKRGYPQAAGTKVTAYSSLRARVTGCYRLFDAGGEK